MEKTLVELEKGTTCSAWNYSGQRLAAASIDGSLSIFDSRDPSSSSFTCSSKFRVCFLSFYAIANSITSSLFYYYLFLFLKYLVNPFGPC